MSIKEQVLQILEHEHTEYVSGQKIAQELGVSRNSVWLAIKTLRSEGWVIESSTNKGYKLQGDVDFISASLIANCFKREHSELELFVFDELDSTLNESKRMVASGFNGLAVIVARHQNAGRGRRGRSFFSPTGGIYLTFMCNGYELAGDAATMTMCAAVATVHALQETCSCKPAIKWVNDIYVDGKKVCGILSEGVADLETKTMSSVSIGIGINVGQQDFPDDLADKAGYVELLEGKTRCHLIAAIVENLLESGMFCVADRNAETFETFGTFNTCKKRILDEYRALSFVIGKHIKFESAGQMHMGIATGIDEQGSLLVTENSGARTALRAGEISLVLPRS